MPRECAFPLLFCVWFCTRFSHAVFLCDFRWLSNDIGKSIECFGKWFSKGFEKRSIVLVTFDGDFLCCVCGAFEMIFEIVFENIFQKNLEKKCISFAKVLKSIFHWFFV